MEFKTVDANGNDLPKGEQGEICLRGPAIINEYWNKPEANAKTFKDGWFATGDVGYIDDEDFLFIVDRIKDMVIRGGENIYCIEVEARIYDHPAVHEVAAFGVPHENLGEELAVAIHFADGMSATQEEIQDWVKSSLAGFKVPTYVWDYGGLLPRNASGKALKNPIKDAYLNK